ncbi:MAG: polyprenyl diphosphate synthase [Candidatus Puniceispirillaceae bacterium]
MLPHHIAIIMDGNRRWAQQRRFEVLRGHSQGTTVLKSMARHAHECGISYLTAFAFSTENWNRPAPEVKGLVSLMKRFLMQDLESLISDNVILRVIGDLTAFDNDLQALFEDAQAKTAANTGLNLTIAVNYGGQHDILQAMQKLQKQGTSITDMSDVKAAMQTAKLPPIDLLIRTGGEQRLSNFLLWDSAYAELHFNDKFWPDYTTKDFDNAIDDYLNRDRRYGGDSILNQVLSET